MKSTETLTLGWRILHANARVLLLLMTPLALALTLIVSLHMVVNSSFFLGFLEEQLQGIFAGRVALTELRVGVDLSRIEAHGVSLTDPSGREAAYVERLELDLRLLSLLDGIIHIQRARIEGGRSLLDFDERGGFSYTDAFYTGPKRADPPDAEPPSLAIYIEAFDVRDLDVLMRFPDFEVQTQDTDLERFSMLIEGGLLRMSAESLRAPHGRATFSPEMFGARSQPPEGPPVEGAKPPLDLDIEDFTIKGFNWVGQSFSVEAFSLISAGITYELTQSSMDLGHPAGLGYKATLKASLPAFARPVEYFTGPLFESPYEVSMTVEGVLGPEMADGSHILGQLDLDLKDLKVMGMTFETGLARGQLVNRRLYLTDFELLGYGGSIRLASGATGPLPPWADPAVEPPEVAGRGHVNLLDLKYNLPIEIEGLHTDALLEDAVPGMAPEALIPATGTLDAVLTASGQLLDREDRERGAMLPAWHRADVREMSLRRPEAVTSRREAGVPAKLIKASGQVHFKQGHLKTERDLLIWLDGDVAEVQIRDLDVQRQALDGRLDLEMGDIAPYASFYGIKGVQGQLSLSLSIDGPLLDPDITDARLVVRQPKLAGLPGDEISTGFSLIDGWLTLTGARVDGSFGHMEAAGSLQIYRTRISAPEKDPLMDLTFEAPRLDLGAIASLLNQAPGMGLGVELGGVASIKGGRVSGRARSPSIEAEVSAGPLKVDGQHIQRVAARMDIDPQRIRVQGLDVSLHPARGRLKGGIDWHLDGKIDAAVRVDGLRLSDVRALKEARVDGIVEILSLRAVGALDLGALRGSGPVGPEGKAAVTANDALRWATTQPAFHLSGAIAGKRLRFGTQQLGDVFGAWNTQSEVFSMTILAVPYVPVSATAGLYEVGGGLVSEDQVLQVRDAVPAVVGLELTVPQRVDAGGDKARARLRVDKLNVRGILAGLLEQKIETEQAAQLQGVRIEAAARSVAATRARSNDLGQRARAVVTRPREVSAPPSRQLLDLLGELTLSGGVDVAIDRAAMKWSLQGTFPELKVAALGRVLTNSEDITLEFKDDLFEIKSLTLGGVTLRGKVSLADDDPDLKLQLIGALDLRLLNLLPDVYTDLKGVAGVNLEVRGRVSDPPELSGMLALSQRSNERLTMRVRSLDDEVVVDSGMVVVCPSRVLEAGHLLESWCGTNSRGTIIVPSASPLRVRALGGTASLYGDVPLDDEGLGRVSVRLKATNMSYHVPGAMDVTFHANLAMTLGDLASPETWELEGDIAIIDGRYYRNSNVVQQVGINRLSTALGGGQTDRFEASSLDRNPIFQKMKFNLDVEIRDGFQVRSELGVANVEMELTANLNLQQTLANPSIVGNLKILSGGKVDFQGRDFIVREGDVTWTGAAFNPALKVTAEAEIQNSCAQFAAREAESTISGVGGATELLTYNLILDIDGPVQAANWTLSSRPFADGADLMALTLFGCTTDQLNASSASKPGLAIALQPLITRVEKEIGRYLDVEEVNISSDLDETRVQLRERITQRFILRFDGAFGAEGAEQSFGGQLIILDNLLLEFGENGSDNEVKLDTNIRLRIPIDLF